MRWLLVILCSLSTTVADDGASEQQKQMLVRRACQINRQLPICQQKRSVDSGPVIPPPLPRVVPPPLPPAALTRNHDIAEATAESDSVPEPAVEKLVSRPIYGIDDREDRTHIHIREQVARHNGQASQQQQGPVVQLTPAQAKELQNRCAKIAPVAQMHCAKGNLRKENLARCRAYFRDCSRFLSESDPLYSIAHSFTSGVDLNLGTWNVKGLPYYPVNEEGSIGSGHLLNAPFGSWGGGFGQHIGVRDYWSQYQEAGANWYEGKYGYKSGWSVPLVQSLGVEGHEHHTVGVPLDKKNFGNINVDNGYGVGGYYQQNDHVGVNWKSGDVGHTFGVGAPFVGAGFLTGQAVTFPSLDAWSAALGR